MISHEYLQIALETRKPSTRVGIPMFDETKLSVLPTDGLKYFLWNCGETGSWTAMMAKKILAKHGDKKSCWWEELAMIILDLAVLMGLGSICCL